MKTDLNNFERFWRACPKRSRAKKIYARECYDKAVASKHLSHIDDVHGYLIERMTAYADSEEGRGNYACHASTWLNRGRWEDDPESWYRTTEGLAEFKKRQKAREFDKRVKAAAESIAEAEAEKQQRRLEYRENEQDSLRQQLASKLYDLDRL